MKSGQPIALIGLAACAGAGFFNYSYDWVLKGSRFSEYAVWYIEQAYWASLLCFLGLWMVAGYKPSASRHFAIIGFSFGAYEGATTGTCRLLITDPSKIPHGMTVCDYLTGLPTQATAITLYFIFVLLTVGRIIRCKMNRSI